jgi:hypothetical protein
LNVKLPDREIETGYGTKWPEQIKDISYFKELAEKAGFIADDQKINGSVFFLELKKP